MGSHYLHHSRFHILVIIFSRHFLNQMRAEVRGHYHYRVSKIHRPALPVCEPAIFEHLQQNVKDIRMGLFDLIQQQ